MPKLTDQPWRKLIPLIPVREHSASIAAALWLPHFKKAGLASCHEQIFAGKQAAVLSRARLLDFRYSNQKHKCLEILLWGYPTGGRGKLRERFLANLPDITRRASCGGTWNEYYKQLNAIGNLGISTITKLAYFHRLSFAGLNAMILDQKLIDAVAGGNWQPLHLPGITYSNAPQRYLEFLQQLHAVAANTHAAPDQIELFLFSWGKAF